MTDQTANAAPQAPAAAAATAPTARTRPLYWSVRRELWENSSVYMAPLIVAGLALLGFVISSFHLTRDLHAVQAAIAAAQAAPGDPKLAKVAAGFRSVLEMPYEFSTGSVIVTSIVVAVFYSLSSLYNERRDRSVLFWKSLPVSDLTTVLSKAALPLIATPLVILAVSVLSGLFILVWSCAVLLATGGSVGDYLTFVPVPFLWVAEVRGLLTMALWYAPIVAWLMLVSGWARRVTILWALGPWAAVCIFELLAFHTAHVWEFVRHRLAGGAELGFAGPDGRPVQHLADLDLMPILTSLELWAGVVVAVALFAGCVRQRRYRDPI